MKEELRFKCLLWARHSARGLMFIFSFFSFNSQNKVGSRCHPHTLGRGQRSMARVGNLPPPQQVLELGFWDAGLRDSNVHTLPTTPCITEASTTHLIKMQQSAACRGYFSSSHIPIPVSNPTWLCITDYNATGSYILAFHAIKCCISSSQLK